MLRWLFRFREEPPQPKFEAGQDRVAAEHADPPHRIDGRWPYILAVRDLASGCQLAWLPVLDETAETTIDALQWLFLEHGPPLVLKSDNGSGFISKAVRRFLDRWQVSPLYSPPRTPEYNGSIEAGNGAKTHTHEEAARQGRAGHWTADDLEAARRMANDFINTTGPAGTQRCQRFRSAPRLTMDARAVFGRTVGREQLAGRSKLGYPWARTSPMWPRPSTHVYWENSHALWLNRWLSRTLNLSLVFLMAASAGTGGDAQSRALCDSDRSL